LDSTPTTKAAAVGDGAPVPFDASIAIVTVTYGRRWHYLEQTLRSALSQPNTCSAIVVDNGAERLTGERLAALAAGDTRVSVVRHEVNRGSAGGFRAGLAAAAAGSSRFVWLLDDDTAPAPGAADALISAWLERARPGRVEVKALLSQRWSGDRYRREREWNENAAFGVDIVARLSSSRVATTTHETDPIVLRMAPWSGLFFERALVESVGLPDERLVLYEDDHDFTLRLTSGGGRILLIPGSRLNTLETSWLDTAPRGLASTWLTTPDPARTYYGSRNRVYVERRYLVTNRARHAANLAAFVVRVAVSGLAPSRVRNLRWFLAGIADGWRGRLGFRQFPLQEKPTSAFRR
jgi:GT2 family glycosyltransferase